MAASDLHLSGFVATFGNGSAVGADCRHEPPSPVGRNRSGASPLPSISRCIL
jgi:hypothetical protein